jgi:hypothetical protein
MASLREQEHPVQYMQPSQHAEMVQTLSIALIVFGTLAAALAIAATRREGPGLIGRVSDFFFGDIRGRTTPRLTAEPATSAKSPTDVSQPDVKATRREIDNFDLSIFEDF